MDRTIGRKIDDICGWLTHFATFRPARPNGAEKIPFENASFLAPVTICRKGANVI
jgi:hypothetical protein